MSWRNILKMNSKILATNFVLVQFACLNIHQYNRRSKCLWNLSVLLGGGGASWQHHDSLAFLWGSFLYPELVEGEPRTKQSAGRKIEKETVVYNWNGTDNALPGPPRGEGPGFWTEFLQPVETENNFRYYNKKDVSFWFFIYFRGTIKMIFFFEVEFMG